ncbi:tetratricopeptide repeat protein [Geomonas sp. RF6]|uniref:tetratricopeptide repeat protein n=1 Tax=Geomonas sp. RF6 TaxID=2897342 RepID=UPI001E50ECEF|nr:tetratricopeptide repeat protein [Geomonas sp. RF6]UFS71053.1 tetratricopeptide repeat protein [Geomonas sp. RF6]
MPTGTKSATLLQRPIFHILILVAVGFLCYSNTFHVPFLFDDDTSIVENPAVHGLQNFLSGGYAAVPNRVVGYLSLALNYEIGGTNVFGYHLLNIAIHVVNALLVYALLRLTFRTPLFRRGCDDTEAGPSANYLPFLVALLFVAHPAQTQAVTYIVQRLTSLATLFFLLSMYLHVRWRLAELSGRGFLSVGVLGTFLLSLVSAALAMKTKEIAFTLPFAVVLYELAFFGVPKRAVIPKLIPMILTAAIIPATMLNLTKPAAQILSDVHSATAVQTTLSRWDYLCTEFSVIVTYLRLLLLPVNQNLDYDYPVSHTLFELRTLLSAAILVALVALGCWLWRKGSKPAARDLLAPAYARLTAFGIFWFFLAISVESSLIPIVDVIFEHRMYLPSFGFFVAVVALVMMWVERKKDAAPAAAKGAAVAIGAVALLFSGATLARNMIWQNPVTLWQDVERKSPGKARPHVNLGTYYGEMERVEDSLREFEIAAKLDPVDPHALSNLVLLYVVTGRTSDASDACTKLHQVDPMMKGDLKLYQILKMPGNGDPSLQAVQGVCSAFR